MQDTSDPKASINAEEVLVAHHEQYHDQEQRDIPKTDIYAEDPHKAALEDNPEHVERLSLTIILSALFLGTSFPGPIVAGILLATPILVQLGEILGGSKISFWVASGFAAAAAVTFSVAGRLSDIFGRRPVLLIGQVLTVVAAIVAASAHSMNQLIAGQVLLGGAIGLVSVAYAGISEILPNKYRGIGLAWTELNLAVWSVAATLLSYVFESRASWRIIYYLAAGYGTFSFVGTLFVYFPPSHPRPDGLTKWQELKNLDYVGALLYISGLAVFLFGLNSGGETYPWKSAGTLAPLIIGLFVFLGAFVYDFNIAQDPLFPWYLFKKFREFSALLALIFVAGMTFYAASALNPQTILYLYTPDPIKIGIYSIPSGSSQVAGVVIAAFVHRIKYVHYQMTVAVFIQTLFFALAALITPYNISWVMAVQFLAMLPFGWITLNTYTTCSLHVPQRDLGVAIGLIGTFRSLGGAIGSVILSSIFNQLSAKQLPERVASVALEAGVSTKDLSALVEAVYLTLLGVADQAATVPSVSASVFAKSVEAARLGYAYGLRITWLSSIPFGVIALLCAAAIRDPSKYFTNHVEVHLEKEIGGVHKNVKEAEEKQV